MGKRSLENWLAHFLPAAGMLFLFISLAAGLVSGLAALDERDRARTRYKQDRLAWQVKRNYNRFWKTVAGQLPIERSQLGETARAVRGLYVDDTASPAERAKAMKKLTTVPIEIAGLGVPPDNQGQASAPSQPLFVSQAELVLAGKLAQVLVEPGAKPEVRKYGEHDWKAALVKKWRRVFNRHSWWFLLLVLLSLGCGVYVALTDVGMPDHSRWWRILRERLRRQALLRRHPLRPVIIENERLVGELKRMLARLDQTDQRRGELNRLIGQHKGKLDELYAWQPPIAEVAPVVVVDRVDRLVEEAKARLMALEELSAHPEIVLLPKAVEGDRPPETSKLPRTVDLKR